LTFTIPDKTIDDIRNAADIVQVISESVSLRRVGVNFVGLCPFHAEKTPSFKVSPARQMFYCFGCQAGGTVFTFLMKRDGLTFPEAISMLADRYGIRLPEKEMSPGEKRRKTEREQLYELNREAAGFFQQVLESTSGGKKARAYLLRRNITDASIRAFRIGFAPDAWDALLRHFTQKGMDASLLESAGLIAPRRGKSGHYDRFRNRVLFPISDGRDRIVGFGGRAIGDETPKYLNSPETPVYSKQRQLFALNLAKAKCRETQRIFLVEGYFDALRLHQHGIQNAAATLGTALTESHVRLIKGLTREAILVFDSDAAGINAAAKSVDIFRTLDMPAKILILPEGHDPDSFVAEFGEKAFMEAADRAVEPMEFLIQRAVAAHGLSPEGKIRIVTQLAEPLAGIQDPLARSVYIRALSETIGIEEAAILDTVRKDARKGATETRNETAAANVTTMPETVKGERLERQIVTMMLHFSEILPEIKRQNILNRFQNPVLKRIGERLLNTAEQNGKTAMYTGFDDPECESLLASLAVETPPDVCESEFWNVDGCLRVLRKFYALRERETDPLISKIEAAEKQQDSTLLMELLKEKQLRAQKRMQ
jgi:DNA primase